MHPEAAFLTGYALALVAVAAGIGSLGRRSTHPRASRMLAAGRSRAVRPGDPEVDWPHSEVPLFHLGVSAVVLAAAALLTAVSIARHRGPTELLAELALLLVIAARTAHLLSALRALAARPEPAGDVD